MAHFPHKRCVYFMQVDDAIKIGCSTKISQRVEQITLDIGRKPTVIGFIYGNFKTEGLIHKRLSQFAEGNEWFRDCPEVRRVIDHLLARPLFSRPASTGCRA